jgi:hypothetical protein
MENREKNLECWTEDISGRFSVAYSVIMRTYSKKI